MKVLFVSSGNNKYGIVPFIKSQGESLKDNGIKLDYYTIKGKGFKGYISNIKPLREFIRKGNYDVIHSHYTLCGWVSLFANFKTNHVISFMGSDIYGEYSENGRRKLTSIYIVMLAKLLQPFVKAIIVKSENLADYIMLKKKMYIVPNGVDYTKFIQLDKTDARKRLGLNLDKKIILFLSDPCNPRKNFKLLSDAEEYLTITDYEMVKPYPTNPENVPLYINAADVLVQPSVQEGSSNLVKEAMACNCPVVSTDSGDAVKVVGNTKKCFITQFDPKDLALKIMKVLDNETRSNGRDSMEHLEINNIAKKIVKIYESIT